MSITKNMRIDVMSYDPEGEKTLLEALPIIDTIKCLRDCLRDKNGNLLRGMARKGSENIVKYIILLYSDDSILNKVPVKPLDERKAIAVDMSGIPKKDGKIISDYEKDLISLGSDKYVEMIFEYLMWQKNILWTQIVTDEEYYSQCVKGLLKRVDMDDDKKALEAINVKSKLRQESNSLRKDLEANYREFFKDHFDVQSKVAVKRSIEDRAR